MATRIIGIDFGTSTTVVRVHNVGENNRVVPMAVNGMRTIPTIAFESSDGEMYYGYDAQAKIDSNAEGNVYKNFKMNLISEAEALRNQAEKLVQGFLRYVYDQYRNHDNAGTFDPADEVKVYVSHPAKWTSSARTLMKQSVAKAGFCIEDNVALKDEPTAAILAVMHEKSVELNVAGMLDSGQRHKAMMIDMGAGTTDIVLCTYQVNGGKVELDDIFPYPSVNTPGLCGGREIDDAIVEEVTQFVNRMQEKPSKAGMNAIKKFSRGVKRWKEQTLSGGLRKNIELPEPDEISAFRDELTDYGFAIMNGNERFNISRDTFEQLSLKHWKQWGELLQGMFNEVQKEQYQQLGCAKRPDEVELLIITGGHSQWYIVPEYLIGKYRLPDLPDIRFTKIQENPELLLQSVDPQETVAVGLCHLDEDVVGMLAASNDISISFTCEGVYLGSCDLIRRGVELPFAKTDYMIASSIKGNFIFRKALQIDYDIITDHSNKITKSITVPADGILKVILKAAVALIGGSLLGIIKLLDVITSGKTEELGNGSLKREITEMNYEVKLSPDLYINEEGIIKVGGTVIVDGNTLQIPEIVI